MSQDALTWLGHATVLLEQDGSRLLCDPVLRARVAHLRRRVPVPPVPAPLDAVLLSHLHRDHLDLPSLRALDPAAPLVVPRGAGRVVRGLRREVFELAAGDVLRLGDVAVRAVPAAHDGRRGPFGARADALGFVVEGTHRVYFAGDTELFGELPGHVGAPDVALLPIWGWGPTLGPGHMDPRQAADALALLRPARAVPIHWGTFLPIGLGRRHGPRLDAPAAEFARHAARVAPEVEVLVLRPGERLVL